MIFIVNVLSSLLFLQAVHAETPYRPIPAFSLPHLRPESQKTADFFVLSVIFRQIGRIKPAFHRFFAQKASADPKISFGAGTGLWKVIFRSAAQPAGSAGSRGGGAAAEGGLAGAESERLAALTEEYARRYLAEELGGLEGKSARFAYLYSRLCESVQRIVEDMAEELRQSEFKPLSFELDFSRPGLSPTAELPGGGSVRLGGIADRVDGWVHGGRLYLRVVDYKTGRKSFSLSDVMYGLGMQMLLYLFALDRSGERLYGMETAPAGVLYVPARDVLLSADSDLPDEEIEKKRRDELRRSGLVLDEPEVLHAMEAGESPVRLPVKWKEGVPTGDSLASAERLGLLGRRVEENLRSLASQLRSGSITADPCYKGAQDNACLWCDYAEACRFTEGEGSDRRRYLPKLSATRVWDMLEGGAENG